jgi:hypothetical protein
MVVERIRAVGTIFGDRVKLALRVRAEEHWSMLALPYLLVVPTVSRVRYFVPEADQQFFVNPRALVCIAQFDGQGSELDWKAAEQIEIAEKQLCYTLVNWHPTRSYQPTIYNGMRLHGSREPHVRVAFTFTFMEQIAFCDFTGDQGCSYLAGIFVKIANPCPCPPPDPCNPAPCPAPEPQVAPEERLRWQGSR